MLRALVFLNVFAIVWAQNESNSTFTTSTSSSASSSISSVEPTTITSAPIVPPTTSSSPPAPSSSLPVTHIINVAKGGHSFSPDITLAEVGDIIEFDFFPTNHSVVRAEYGYPCIPYENTGVNKFGFFSGFHPVDAYIPVPPKWSIRVNDSNPIFFYCGAKGSCINYQMVGVINPNATTSLVIQKELAAKSTYMLLPGEPVPPESNDTSVATGTASPSGPGSSSTSAPTDTASNPMTSGHDGLGLTPGAIAGIAIGSALVALFAAVALFLCGRHSRKDDRPMSYYPPPMSSSSYRPFSSSEKHMSMHSFYNQPAYPSYMAQPEPGMSPRVLSSYAPSDMILSPGADMGHSLSPRSSHHYAMSQYSGFRHSKQMYAELDSGYQGPLINNRPETRAGQGDLENQMQLVKEQPEPKKSRSSKRRSAQHSKRTSDSAQPTKDQAEPVQPIKDQPQAVEPIKEQSEVKVTECDSG